MTDKIEVLIYNGYDAGPNGVDNTKKALSTTDFNVAMSGIINSSTLADKKVFILGGGDSGWSYLNNPNLVWKDIKKFVEKGGGLFATCAGAYAASARVVNPDGTNYYTTSKPQGLAPRVVSRVIEDEMLVTPFVWVGPECKQLGKEPVSQNIVHYRGPAMYAVDVNDPPIIFNLYNKKSHKNSYNLAGLVGDYYGKGKVILSGPHPELDPKDYTLIRNIVKWVAKTGSEIVTDENVSNDQIKITQTTFSDMSTRVDKYFKDRGLKSEDAYAGKISKHPGKVYLKPGEAGQYVTWEKWLDIRNRYWQFVNANKRAPGYIWIVKPTVTEPETTKGWILTGYFESDYQDTGYTCGPSSLEMVLSALGIEASESQLARLAGTTTEGTSHAGLYAAASKISSSVKHAEYSLSEIGWSGVTKKLQAGSEFIIHIMTGTLPNWEGDYGHYIFLVGVNVDEGLVRVFDPTKGSYTYTFNQIQTAMNQISQKSLLMFYKG